MPRSARDCSCTPASSLQSPEEWQQWHTVTRKAIRKHAIDSVTDIGTPDEHAAHYLIHAHCRRRIGDGTSPALLPAASLQGLLEPSCPEIGHGQF